VAEGQASPDILTAWDESLVGAGLLLCEKRAAFLEDFSPRVSRVHARVSGGKEKMELIYKPSVPGPWDGSAERRWLEELILARPREIAIGSTLHGPQRDDILFQLNGRPAREFGSEGQKRTGAVSFKLAEIPFIQEKLNQKPICLLDDVLSELDTERAEHLLDELSRTGQCFVTLTGLEAWPRHRDLPASVYKVDEAGIRKDNRIFRHSGMQLTGIQTES
jgi:DNA replication and repair protein RecF